MQLAMALMGNEKIGLHLSVEILFYFVMIPSSMVMTNINLISTVIPS